MKIKTTEPEWIVMSFAARRVDPSWYHTELEEFMIAHKMITAKQLWNQIGSYNIIRKRPKIEITDYSMYLFEISDHALERVKELYAKDQAKSQQLSLSSENKS